MDLGLKEKIALVTGSSRGLGLATARLLSMEGATVITNSRHSDLLIAASSSIQQTTGNTVFPVAGDVSLPGFPDELVKLVISRFGRLDILVTNAGGPPAGSFDSFDDAAWQKANELTFMSYVRLIRAALPFLKQSSNPAILTVTSYSTKQPIPNLVLSNSIRAGVIGLTKSLALELGVFGIRVNSILPAWTETERVQTLMKSRAEQNGTSIEEEIQKQSRESPLGRMCTPQEFANAAVFLVSPAASYITGTMLSVDGGMYKGI